MTDQTQSEAIRTFIRNNQPVSVDQIAVALGIKRKAVDDACRPGAKRGLLTCDKQGRYSIGREPKRLIRHGAKLAARQRDYDQRKGEQALAVQAVRLREIGASRYPQACDSRPSSDAFISEHPDKFQRLPNGAVSKASQFLRIGVA